LLRAEPRAAAHGRMPAADNDALVTHDQKSAAGRSLACCVQGGSNRSARRKRSEGRPANRFVAGLGSPPRTVSRSNLAGHGSALARWRQLLCQSPLRKRHFRCTVVASRLCSA
jgi:hypothetical protein